MKITSSKQVYDCGLFRVTEARAVDAQAGWSESTLGQYRRALAIRRRLVARLPARFEWVQCPAGVLAYRRGPLTVACNFSSRTARLRIQGKLLLGSAPLVASKDGFLRLPPDSAAWVAA